MKRPNHLEKSVAKGTIDSMRLGFSWLWACCLALLAVFLGGCGSNSGSKQADGKLVVVATTGMIADAVKQVGGDRVEVIALMGPGIDPHLYKASPGDITKINSADLIFFNGLHLEGKMADVFEKVGRKKPTIAVGEAVPEAERLSWTGGVHDPHIWFDVKLWRNVLTPIQEALSKAEPSHAAEFAANASRYGKELDQLDAEIRVTMDTIPESKRILVTAHDAFHYFGRAYGIRVHAIQGISTESEAGLSAINGLVQLLVNSKIPAVFVETSVSEKNIQALVEGVRARGGTVAIGGKLFSDAMGAAGTPEGTYVGMVRHNAKAIVDALK